MSIIKCKMCGGDLKPAEGTGTAECEFCGTLQTIPTLDNEKKLIQFERAERLRKQCEFDKAAGVYEAIVAEYRYEAEAYWGLVLCKYGIEYVDDPGTGKKIPTCHRSSFDSIMEDPDLDLALENADSVARKVYRTEAKQIEELRRGILAVSSNEEPYDIFICYKETADDGQRTLDSVLAQDVYEALIQKGYRVFFSRISLEDKLGMEYEPYIFAALNSARIMLVFGTDYEYYNAVWVKNEWARFLKLMEKDKSKYLIPCFKGIDAYDIPREFARLQAQDLGKVGAIQDLLRGIEKLLPREISQPVAAPAPVVTVTDSKLLSLLDRGNMALEDGDWKSADGFFEEVLNNDSKNAEAYLGKVLATAQQPTLDAFIQSRASIAGCSMTETFLTIPEARERIEDAIASYCIPNYLSREQLKKAYAYDLRYTSTVVCRQRQYEQEEGYWNSHKTLIRAEKFATGAFAQTLAAAKEALFTLLDQRIQEAKDLEETAKLDLQARYSRHLEQAERQAEALYQSAIANREQQYQKIRSLAMESSDALILQQIITELEQMGDFRDCPELAARCHATLEQIGNTLAQGRDLAALVKTRICASPNLNYPVHAGLTVRGEVLLSVDFDEYRNAMRYCRKVLAVSMGEFHGLLLGQSGSIAAVGDNKYGQCNVSNWRDITAIAAGGWHSVGLHRDGTVCAAGINEGKECNVSTWKNIVKIGAGRRHTVGLKADGTVVATGLNDMGQCNVTGWTDVVDIFVFNGQTVGLRKDGTLLAAGTAYSVNHWTDIVKVSLGYESILGLRKDGTVLFKNKDTSGEQEIRGWQNIVDISAKNSHWVGLRADGTVVAAGLNDMGQCDVKLWKNIVAVCAGDFCTLGIRSDGSVAMAGNCPKQRYTGIYKWGLFSDASTLESELARQRLQAQWQQQQLCRHCGGEFKGGFIKKCAVCGKAKDY